MFLKIFELILAAMVEFGIFTGIWFLIFVMFYPFIFFFFVCKKLPHKYIELGRVKFYRTFTIIISIIMFTLFIILISNNNILEIIKVAIDYSMYKFLVIPIFFVIFFFFLRKNKKQKRPVIIAELGMLIIIFSLFSNALFQFEEMTDGPCDVCGCSHDTKNREIHLSCKENCISLEKALIKYKEKNGKYPEKLKELEPGYLKEIPECPVSADDYYYTTDKTRDRFTLYCSGENHKFLGFPKDYPCISK